MILKITFATIMTLMGTLAQDPFPIDSYLSTLSDLSASYNEQNFFDGPGDVSHAVTNPTSTKRPTPAQMLYYAYYAASVPCPYELDNLSCRYCQYFRNDIDEYKVITNDTYDTLALVTVSRSREEIVITFRGSENIWNFVLDFTLLDVNADAGNPIKIHRGFYAALMSLYEPVVESVNYQRLFHPNYKIVIVGHSLGGSMTRLCEFFFLFENEFPGVKYEVYTYGELRSGNKYYIDFLNNQPNVTTARVVNKHDFAPHIIPTSIAGTEILHDYYLHAQSEYWITDNGSAFCNNSVYEDPNCSDSVGLSLSAVDHETYFGLNFFYCLANQPLTFFALPFNGFQPVKSVPPLPGPISTLLGGFSDLVLGIIGPILGR